MFDFWAVDVITLSSSGSVLRAWNLPDGQLVWESFLEGSNSSKSLLSVPVRIEYLQFLFEYLTNFDDKLQ